MKISDIKIEDKDVRVVLECGHILCEAARFEEAETVFRGLAEYLTESELPLIGLSNVFLQNKNFEKAKLISQTAVEKFPDSLYAKINNSEAKFYCQERSTAIDELKQLIEENPDTPEAETAKSFIKMVQVIYKLDV